MHQVSPSELQADYFEKAEPSETSFKLSKHFENPFASDSNMNLFNQIIKTPLSTVLPFHQEDPKFFRNRSIRFQFEIERVIYIISQKYCTNFGVFGCPVNIV